MNDFGSKVRQAAKEVAAKVNLSQSREKAKAPYGYKKDGTPRKRPAQVGRWKKGEAGNPDTVWKPGESGNPGGKMKKTPITDAMREMLHQPYIGKEARFKGKSNAQVMALRQFELAIETGDMRAAIEITDRVEGKTVQIQQHQGSGGGAIPFMSLTPEENEKRIATLEALARGESAESAL